MPVAPECPRNTVQIQHKPQCLLFGKDPAQTCPDMSLSGSCLNWSKRTFCSEKKNWSVCFLERILFKLAHACLLPLHAFCSFRMCDLEKVQTSLLQCKFKTPACVFLERILLKLVQLHAFWKGSGSHLPLHAFCSSRMCDLDGILLQLVQDPA